MAKQVVKLGLEFDTKQAIQSYRDLVSEMSKGGADPKAIKQFTSAIEKAETELAQLAAEGSTGFTDSKGIEQYQKKVLKTVTSMQQLALRMQDFSKEGKNFPLSEAGKLEQKIKDLKKAVTDLAEEAKKNLQSSLKNMGFSKTQAAEIANAVKTEEELKQRLEQERQLRQKNLDLAREQAQASVDAARGTKASSVESNSTRVKALTSGVDKISGVNPEAIKETVAEAFRSGIRKGVNNANDIVADLKKTFAQQSGEGTEITNALSEMLDKGLEASGDNISGWLNSIALKTGEALNPEKFKDLVAALNQVSVAQTNVVAGQFGVKMQESAQAAADAATAEGQLGTATANTNKVLQQSEQVANGLAGTMEQSAQAFLDTSNAQKQSVKSTELLEGGFNRLTDRLKYMFGFTAMFNRLRSIIRSTFNDLQELDKAYASIAYVTNETVNSLWSTYNQYAEMAEKLGQSTADVIKASAIYRQQGLDTKEALELTTDTMKLATIAGNDYSTATQEMTAALRGFKMEMDEGSHVSDVYSELAAHAAASVDDIAQAMSRTASIANSAGMSFENTSAFLTQMIETTQESAENIGTSMKTIIARFTELKENVAGTADSEFDDLSFNKVDEALKSVGVALKDTSGQFRDLDEVFLELSAKWDTLDRNTQRYIATVAAGSRQQSRFIALMDNYDRTIELIDTVADSEGKADEQFAKAADTFEFKLNAIKTKWEELKLEIMDSGFVKGLLDKVNSFMDSLNNLKMPQLAFITPFAIMAAKMFILSFVKTIKEGAGQWQAVGKLISNNIAKKLTRAGGIKLRISVAEQDLVKIQNTINQLTQQIQNNKLNNLIPANVIRNNMQLITRDVQQFQMYMSVGLDPTIEAVRNSLNNYGLTTEQVDQILKDYDGNLGQLINDLGTLKTAYQGVDQETANYAASTQKLSQLNSIKALTEGVSSGLTTIGQSMSMAAMSFAAGAGAADSLKMAFTSLASQGIAMLFKFIPQLITYFSKENQAAIASAATTVASEEAKQKAIEKTSIVTKAALLTTLSTMAVIAAAAAIVYGLAKLIEYNKKAKAAEMEANSVTIQRKKEIEKLNKAIEEQKEHLSKINEELNKQRDIYNKLNEAEDKYLDNNGNTKLLSSEDQKNWLALQQEIAEIMPELIDHYDAEGNAILKIGESFKKSSAQIKQSMRDLEKEAAQNRFDIASESFQITEKQRENNAVQKNIKEDLYFQALSTLNALNTKVDTGNLQNSDYGDTYVNLTDRDDAVDSLSKDKNGYWINNDFWGGNKVTAVGLLKGLQKKGNGDMADYFRDALIAAGVNNDFGIDDKTATSDIYDNIMDALTEGDYMQEIRTFEIFQDAINDYQNKLESDSRELVRQQRENEKELDEAIVGLIDANASAIEGYDSASANTQAIMKKYAQKQQGVSMEDLTAEFNENHKDWIDQYGNVLDEYAEMYFKSFNSFVETRTNNAVDEKRITEVLSSFTEDQIKALDSFYERNAGQVGSDLLNSMQQDVTISEDVKTAWLVANQELIDGRIEQATNILKALGLDTNAQFNEYGQLVKLNNDDIGLTNFINGLSTLSSEALERILIHIENELGSDAAKKYLSDFQSKTKGFSKTTQDQILGQDWSSYGTLTSSITDNQQIQKIAATENISYEAAKQAWESAVEMAKAGGETISDITAAQVREFGNQTEGIEKAFSENGSKIAKYLQGTTGDIKITAQEGKELKTVFDKMAKEGVTGLDAALTKFDKTTGTWILDTDLLRQNIEQYTTKRKEAIEQAIADNKKLANTGTESEKANRKVVLALLEEELAGLDSETAYLNELIGLSDSLASKIELISKHIDNMSSAITQFQKDGYVSAESLEKIVSIVGSGNIGKYVDENLALNEQGLLDYVDAEIAALEAEQALTGVRSIELLQLKALRKEMENTKKELNENTKELDDKHKKAMEDYAKAQQDVIDKQKALNEAIEDYNKLLYGSDNRKSTLDPLYNYQQAISYLNDEISRTKEILEDSKGFDEASENLNKYLSAAHYQLVQYQAENKVLEEGLAIRRNNLLNGSVSYQGINVKFGDYVKIDEKTGLASIDQQLIQNAKIADKWKDQIESFVDDYNKYSQELLKNQDAVRKAEKEIQQFRMDATKKWADFEKSIAETLKNEYQEEVNALKEKYDSMKDADDDYINALEEAINKQRKLRDRENQLEQLAQKEKKLSLLRRDTSGANTLATKKLEKEIEQDREKMLDDKIDDVIENIQKLSEKQDELRQAEIELKEALLDDALYWNMTAETVAQSFTSVDEFLSWSVKHNKEYLEMTEQQRQEFLDSETKKFNESIGAMAILTRDEIDSIENQIEVTAEEINTTVQNTGEVFTIEVSRVINETSAELNKEIADAQNKIQSAIQALVDANEKLREASQKVDEIAAKLAGLSYNGGSYATPAIDYGNTSADYAEQVGTGQTVGQHEIEQRKIESAFNNFKNLIASNRGTDNYLKSIQGDYAIVSTPGLMGAELEELAKLITSNYKSFSNHILVDPQSDDLKIYKNGVPLDPYYTWNPKFKIYKNGGLVNYTGPAWVDGTSNTPEAFLSAEDTERIGNAAKLLSNIPALNHSNISTTNSSYGDTNIEINLNIDHISSDVDIEEMLDKVKQEIVDIARPIGTNVILHQQI